MYRYQGEIIRKARNEQHLTQEELIKEIGEYQVSLRTLQRIEKGELNINAELANIILDYFGIDLMYRLQDEQEVKIMKAFLFKSALNVKECVEGANIAIQERRALFHGEKNGTQQFPIVNLPQFLIYLPLFAPSDLYECLRRIEGDICGRNLYVLEQCEYLYNTIPCSNVKRTVDKLAKRMSFDGGCSITYKEQEAYRKLILNKASCYAHLYEAGRRFMDIQEPETLDQGAEE